ncbi:hypothetical protein QOT17_008567 [Balamuthia mandrillaris]
MLHHSATTSKMDLKYLGPFSVKYRTKSGADVLVDVTGNELEDHILPSLLKLSRLRAVPFLIRRVYPPSTNLMVLMMITLSLMMDDEDSSYEVSKVLDHCGPANC